MKILLVPTAALLAGCMPIPGPPAPPYHALGTEPFWNLLIDERDVTFTQPDAQPIRQPRPLTKLSPQQSIEDASQIAAE